MAAFESTREVTHILVDTGFLVAVYDQRERMHRRCLQIYDSLVQPLVTCEAVLSEALHLLRHARGGTDGILESVGQGIIEIPFVLTESAGAVKAVMAKYRDIPADFADACLIHMADQMDTGDILTLDGGFKHYRWRKNRRFRMLIPLD
jgi:predicted nucleic acid-binding protein